MRSCVAKPVKWKNGSLETLTHSRRYTHTLHLNTTTLLSGQRCTLITTQKREGLLRLKWYIWAKLCFWTHHPGCRRRIELWWEHAGIEPSPSTSSSQVCTCLVFSHSKGCPFHQKHGGVLFIFLKKRKWKSSCFKVVIPFRSLKFRGYV